MEQLRIAVVIPTFNRIKKLERCIRSLENQTYKKFDIHIYADNNDEQTRIDISKLYSQSDGYIWPVYDIQVNDKQEYVTGSWNKFFKDYSMKYDAVALLVDDVELYPNYLEELVKSMQSNYPDLDGVIGAKQECPGRDDYTFKYYGQTLIGRKFIERYKDVEYAVWCPFYKHFFPDEEMWIYANSLGKFVNCETAVLKHYHPAFVSEEVDQTHNLIRGEVKRYDKTIYEMRKNKNLVWGKTWQEK